MTKKPAILKDLQADAREAIRLAMAKKVATAKTAKTKTEYETKCSYMPYPKKDGTVGHSIGFKNKAQPLNNYLAIKGGERFAVLLLEAIDAGNRESIEAAITMAKYGKSDNDD